MKMNYSISAEIIIEALNTSMCIIDSLNKVRVLKNDEVLIFNQSNKLTLDNQTINDLLLISRKDIHLLAEYISKLQDPELFIFKALVSNFIRSEDDFNNILVESKNLFIMKKYNFDILGVPQYLKSKLVIENLVKRLNQYNLVRDFKYININYIEELKEYLKRVEDVLKYFDNGKLISQIKDIKEIE